MSSRTGAVMNSVILKFVNTMLKIKRYHKTSAFRCYMYQSLPLSILLEILLLLKPSILSKRDYGPRNP